MQKQRFLITLCVGTLLSFFSYAQDDFLTKKTAIQDSIVIQHTGPDTKYLEDQFYVGFTFNILDQTAKGINQSGFSGGIHLGYIRDIPLNKRGNFGLGAGVGWSVNAYRTNLLISQDENGNSLFQTLNRSKIDYDVNRFSTYLVEAPIQLRWRTSTAESYKFWRIYAGVRIGYLYYFHSKFSQPGKTIYKTDVAELQRLRYGLTFTFGYNTFNFTVYHSLNPFFKNAQTIDNRPVELSTFKIGLEFYIL